MPKLILLLLLPFCLQAQPFSPAEIKRWKAQAQNVTIQRDNWGIPHIYGNTDADAVFGLLYAQCEDDFKRVEMNYIEKLGRLAEVKGDTALYDDLYLRLIIDSAEAMADYRRSPSWLKQLLQAYADGINYYLYTHPAEKPLLLRRFQAWYPLLWTDGSIGAISTGDITENDVKAFYGGGQPSPPSAALLERQARREMLGSNGFAIAPALSATGNALLYINPHVTFYFRPEVQVASKQGLNVYGAVTWGQFFVYQGFNEYCGWMHTSSNVDVADLYAEQIIRQNGRLLYRYDGKLLPVRQKRIGLRYQTAQGMQTKTFTAYYTHHGPIMGQRNGQWIAVRGYNRSLTSLLQSWLRTKSTGYASYRQTMQLRSNTSNNTVFADREGNIAYWHGNYVPVRDSRYNWSKPVDGSTSATEWKGLHELAAIVQLRNPPNGWIQNCNSTPFTAAGSNSPVRERYPSYMAPDGENFRGLNAARVLAQQNRYTLDKLIAAGYDRTLAIFEVLLPSLIRAFDSTVVPGSPQHALLQGPIQELRQWDYRCDNASVATTLAVEWAQRLSPLLQKVYADIGEPDQVANARQLAAHASANELLQPLQQTVETLQRKFGKWQLPWGQLNRYQRIGSDIDQRFNDAQPSQPVPFASSTWGMLPAYNSKYYPGSQLRYGVGGNSFVCAVEFGKKIKAQSLLAGGQSGHADSPHFTDQLLMYTEGRFKDVLFYQEDVDKHTVKKYHPGE